MKVFALFLPFLFCTSLFASVFQGDFKGDACYLLVDVSNSSIELSVTEDPEGKIDENHLFSIHHGVWLEEIEEGVVYFTNLPSESSNLLGWALGIRPKTYFLNVTVDDDGIPISYEMSSQKEGKSLKSLVRCGNLQEI